MPARRLRSVGLVFVGAVLLGLFVAWNVDCVADGLPKGLPAWFGKLDTDADGQISLHEWRRAGKHVADFQRYDLDNDGLVTPEEVLRAANAESFLRLVYGRLRLDDEMPEATGEKYREKKTYKIFTITLDEGKTYQIEELSQVYYAYIYLENADGVIVAKKNSGGRGRVARIVYKAAKSGTYRIIASSQDGYKTGPFSLTILRLVDGRAEGGAPELPASLKNLDADHDGQVALHEWRNGGKKLAEFRKYDRDNDGFITPQEVAAPQGRPIALKFKSGKATYKGTIESADPAYLGKKIAKFFTVWLKSGKTYRIDHSSRAFDAFLYLADAEGNILAQNDDGPNGLDSQIVHKAEGGSYQLIATSLNGSALGAFSLSVLDVSAPDTERVGTLPSWFRALDLDNDGQVGMDEWKKSRKDLAEFQAYDQDNDGFLTPREVLQPPRRPIALRLQRGQATYTGAIEAADFKYKGKKIAKIFTVPLRAGITYQFDHMSKAFDAFLYLENPDGAVLAQNDDGGRGTDSRIKHRAATDGAYRLIATSLPGIRLGAFTLTVRVVADADGTAAIPLPPWFHGLDADNDGQVALHEWREGGKSIAEFRTYDLDDDGFITPDEMVRYLQLHPELSKKTTGAKKR